VKGGTHGRRRGERGPQVGDVCVTTRRIGGGRPRGRVPARHLRPTTGAAVRGTNGPIRALLDLTVVPLTEDRSRLTISVDFQGHGIGRVVVPLMVRREARREMPLNLATLKANLEA
jgi:hypothetical protein